MAAGSLRPQSEHVPGYRSRMTFGAVELSLSDTIELSPPECRRISPLGTSEAGRFACLPP
jgi:hypothetical protein